MPTIFLIRHGESQSNAGLPTTYPKGVKLTERGLEQAECIARYLKSRIPLDLIVTSPYQRTKQTAAPTKSRFPSVPQVEWPVKEFTYLSTWQEVNSTIEDRRQWVEAYWELSNPFYVDGPWSE